MSPLYEPPGRVCNCSENQRGGKGGDNSKSVVLQEGGPERAGKAGSLCYPFYTCCQESLSDARKPGHSGES